MEYENFNGPAIDKTPSLIARAGKLALYCTLSAATGFSIVYASAKAYEGSSKEQIIIVENITPFTATDPQGKPVNLTLSNSSIEDIFIPRKMPKADLRSELDQRIGTVVQVTTVGWHIPALSWYPVVNNVKK